MSDEFLPIGQLSNKNKLVETSSSGTVAPLVASWAQASTEVMGLLGASTAILGYVKIDQTTPGTSNAVTVATTSGGILFSTGLPGKVQALASTEKIGALQTSTEIVGYVKIDQTTPGASNAVVVTTTSGAALFSTGLTGKVQALASTDVIGYIVANASTAKIGALQASTESIGYVTALVSTAKIGALQASTESIGYVTGLVSTAKIGALQASTESIGYITALVSTAKIGALQASTENIGDVDVTSVIPGTGATNLGKAVDAASAGSDTGIAPLAIRDDALAALTPVEGDYVPLRTDANGALWTHDDALDAALAGNEIQVDVVAALPAGANILGQVGIDQTTPGTTNAVVIENTAGALLTISTDGFGITDAASGGNSIPVQGSGRGYNGASWDRLRTLAASGDGLGVQKVGTGIDDAAFPAAGVITTLGALADEANPDSVDEGDIGALRMTLNRILRIVPSLHDGTTEGADSMRGNIEGTLLVSAARTATVPSSDQVNRNARGVRVRINVSSVTDTPSITVAIEEKDSISGNYVAILTSAAITTTGQKTTLVVYPGIAAVANVKADDPLPRTWRVNVTHGDADSITYSIDYAYIL